MTQHTLRAAALLTGLLGTAAFAQESAPTLPAPQDRVPEKVRPENGTGGSTLSDKLEKSDGVIKPPAGVDPEIRTIAPEPSPNSMPVIKPPGNAR